MIPVGLLYDFRRPCERHLSAALTRTGQSGPMTRRMTKSERLAAQSLLRQTEFLRFDDTFDEQIRDLIPDAWRTLEQDLDVEEKKVRITLRLDESVAKFYRAMGKGYQARINRLLATYAQMQILKSRHDDTFLTEWRTARSEKRKLEERLAQMRKMMGEG